MKSLIGLAFATLIAFLSSEFVEAQTVSSVGPRGNLRSRLPFSGPADANVGQTQTSPGTLAASATPSWRGNYTGWAGNVYPGMGTSIAQTYGSGRGLMVPIQRPNVRGVGASAFNPANPNAQRGGIQTAIQSEGQYADEGAWLDYEPAPQTAYPAGSAQGAGTSVSSNTSNASNLPVPTAATIPGANQEVPTSSSAASTAPGELMQSQPSQWRFYLVPSSDQTSQASSRTTPAASQQPSGVSEAAAGGPIKY
jgi:hypothetical protein